MAAWMAVNFVNFPWIENHTLRVLAVGNVDVNSHIDYSDTARFRDDLLAL